MLNSTYGYNPDFYKEAVRARPAPKPKPVVLYIDKAKEQQRKIDAEIEAKKNKQMADAIEKYKVINIREVAELLEGLGVDVEEVTKARKPRTVQQIIRLVSRYTGIAVPHITGRMRRKEFARVRFLVCWLAYRYCENVSLPKIGRVMGNRDHTTILHAVRSYEKMRAEKRASRERGKAMSQDILEALKTVLSEDDARAVIDHRRVTIKKPLTVRAAQNMAKQFAMVDDPTEAVDFMIDRGYQGFKAAWLHNANQGRGRMQASTANLIEMGRRLN